MRERERTSTTAGCVRLPPRRGMKNERHLIKWAMIDRRKLLKDKRQRHCGVSPLSQNVNWFSRAAGACNTVLAVSAECVRQQSCALIF